MIVVFGPCFEGQRWQHATCVVEHVALLNLRPVESSISPATNYLDNNMLSRYMHHKRIEHL